MPLNRIQQSGPAQYKRLIEGLKQNSQRQNDWTTEIKHLLNCDKDGSARNALHSDQLNGVRWLMTLTNFNKTVLV